ncbi:unnamed protein product [Nesidiocoris tenuis]|uniref:Uncharacterized protein n=1 Tax=Nesidiocoris tenuis TaxID=355587 RepID=A0A6H5H2R3_9HEMI|nr:unnamed protein product [Nesidiocoris tenuis]
MAAFLTPGLRKYFFESSRQVCPRIMKIKSFLRTKIALEPEACKSAGNSPRCVHDRRSRPARAEDPNLRRFNYHRRGRPSDVACSPIFSSLRQIPPRLGSVSEDCTSESAAIKIKSTRWYPSDTGFRCRWALESAKATRAQHIDGTRTVGTQGAQAAVAQLSREMGEDPAFTLISRPVIFVNADFDYYQMDDGAV